MLSGKADVEIVDQLKRLKTNKADSEGLSKQIDTVHQQMSHFAVLIAEMMKLQSEASGETRAQRLTKQMFLIH